MELTEAGFYKAIRNNSLKVSTVEKFTQEVKITLQEFFSNAAEQSNKAGESLKDNGSKVPVARLEVECTLLRERVKDLEKINELLEEIHQMNKEQGRSKSHKS